MRWLLPASWVFRIVTSFWLSMLVSAHGLAQPAAGNAATPMEVVRTTATRIHRDVDEISSAVTVVPGERISPGAEVMAEALRGTIGGFVQQTTPGQGSVIVRGLKGSQVLHLVDGMRLNNALFRSAPNQYLALVDPFVAEAIDVVRGPSGSLYGSDAMGGVVNILTHRPDFSATPVISGTLYGGLSSADLAKSVRGQLDVATPRVAFRGGMSQQRFGGRQTGGSERIPFTGYRSRAADAKLVVGLSEGLELTLTGQYLKQPSTPRVDELNVGFGQTDAASDEFFFEPNRRRFYHARLDWSVSRAWIDGVQVNLAQQTIDDDRRTRDRGGAERRLESNSSRLNGLNAQFVTNFETGGLVYGFEFYNDDIASRRVSQDLSTGITESIAPRFPDGARVDSFGLFVDREWSVSDRWTLTTGVRYSEFDLKFAGSNGTENRLRPNDFSGDISLRFAMTPKLSVVANFGRGFRAPNIFDVGALGARPGNRFNILNPNLDPEYVTSIDVGVKARQDRFAFEAFFFHASYRDRITAVPTGDLTPTGRTVVRSENIGEVELYGVEAGLRLLPRDGTELFVVANATRGTERQTSGLRVAADRIPPLNARVGLRHQIGSKLAFESHITGNANQSRLSPRDIGDPRIDPNGTPGWLIWDMSLFWEASDRFDVRLELNNALDRRYREHGSGLDARGRDFRIGFNRRF